MENQTTWMYCREKNSLYLKYGILTVLHPWSQSPNALKNKYCHCPFCLWKSNQIWKYSFVCSLGSTEVFDGKTFSNQILVFFLNQFLAVFNAALTLFLLRVFFFFLTWFLRNYTFLVSFYVWRHFLSNFCHGKYAIYKIMKSKANTRQSEQRGIREKDISKHLRLHNANRKVNQSGLWS